jgi:protein-S-isoprenylcysteine O-methyltransferase Ste14
MHNDLLIRHFLAIFFLFIGLLYSFKGMGHQHRTGFSHINYGNASSATWWNRQLFNIFRSSILAICILRLAYDIDDYLVIISPLYNPWVMGFGCIMLLSAFSLISYLHGYVGNQWRSGIDLDQSPPLLTEGIFSRTRNPFFLSVILGQLGFFLALPSVFSLICLLVGAFVIRRQALAEETALAATFGDAYTEYRNRVPRWL